MANNVKPIPDGYHTITPYLIVNGAAEAIEFYKKAFGAVEMFRLPGTDGKVGHCELKFGDSVIMLADEYPDMGARGPKTIGGSPVQMFMYVGDVDTVFNNAVEAGAKIVRELEDKFYGDRAGGLEDPFGHTWYLATHVRDVSPEEIEQKSKEMIE